MKGMALELNDSKITSETLKYLTKLEYLELDNVVKKLAPNERNLKNIKDETEGLYIENEKSSCICQEWFNIHNIEKDYPFLF